MLRKNSTHFMGKYENRMYGGNTQWADPEEAIKVGEAVGEELIARFEHHDYNLGDSLQVGKCAHKVLNAALDVVDYAALPTERRANILHGVINALVSCDALGGEPEWAQATTPTEEPVAVD